MCKPSDFLIIALFTSAFAAAATAADSPFSDPNPGAPLDRAIISNTTFPQGLLNWKADGDKGVYLQSSDTQWFHATFFMPCLNMPFATKLSFISDGPKDLTQFSSILVRDQQCWFKTFEMSDPPKDAE